MVIVYTLRNCEVSEKAVKALTERSIAFEERRVDQDVAWWEEALNYSDAVPVIIWDNGDVELGWEGEHG